MKKLIVLVFLLCFTVDKSRALTCCIKMEGKENGHTFEDVEKMCDETPLSCKKCLDESELFSKDDGPCKTAQAVNIIL